MAKRYQSTTEPHLMEHLSKKGNPTYGLVDHLRECALDNKFVKPSSCLKNDAKSEWEEIVLNLDHGVYEVSQNWHDIGLGKTLKKRAVVLIKGYFRGPNKEDFHTMLHRDLGNNPWRLFKRHPKSTVDAYITKESAEIYIEANRKRILDEGYNHFYTEASRFFYFREKDLLQKNFMRKTKKGYKLDFNMIIPAVAELPGDDPKKGYVGLDELWRPNIEKIKKYDKRAIEHFSHRFKQASVVDKIKKKLFLSKDSKYLTPICDLIGDRMVVSEEHMVKELMEIAIKADFVEKELKEYRDDYYKNPKETGFRNLNLAFIINKIARELQIVDLQQYFKNELDPTDPAHHLQQKKKQNQISNQPKKLVKSIEDVLNEVFHFEPIIIPV